MSEKSQGPAKGWGCPLARVAKTTKNVGGYLLVNISQTKPKQNSS